MKALSGSFGGIKFIPTGGVNGKNLGEYVSAPFIYAVGGSRLCAKADIAAHNFEKITSLCKEAGGIAPGFERAHVGINAAGAEESITVCGGLDKAFGFGVKEGNSSNFAGTAVEAMKEPYLGANGHIANPCRIIFPGQISSFGVCRNSIRPSLPAISIAKVATQKNIPICHTMTCSISVPVNSVISFATARKARSS